MALPGALLLVVQLPHAWFATQPLLRATALPSITRARTLSSQGDASAYPPALGSSPLSAAPFSVVEVCASGQVNRYKSPLTSIRTLKRKLSSRDARLLRSSTPALLPRNDYIVFDLGKLKGVLQSDRVSLIDQDRLSVGALGDEIQQRLALSSSDIEESPDYPFELRALECVLELTYSLLEQSLERLSALVTTTLSELTDSSPYQSDSRRAAALGRLLPVQISLNSLQTKARRLTEVLAAALENEDDLLEMCLSLSERRTAEGGSALVEAAGEAETSAEELKEEEEDEVELLENLLDVYSARLEALSDQIEEVLANIETTQAVLELTLDNERNRIARLELLLSMGGLCVGSCAMVSGFFGMNLVSGLEVVGRGGVFWGVTLSSLTLASGLFGACWRRFRLQSGQQRTRLNDAQALKRVLANVDAVALLLRTRPLRQGASGAEQGADELRALLGNSDGLRRMSDRELSLMARILRLQDSRAQLSLQSL